MVQLSSLLSGIALIRENNSYFQDSLFSAIVNPGKSAILYASLFKLIRSHTCEYDVKQTIGRK